MFIRGYESGGATRKPSVLTNPLPPQKWGRRGLGCPYLWPYPPRGGGGRIGAMDKKRSKGVTFWGYYFLIFGIGYGIINAARNTWGLW